MNTVSLSSPWWTGSKEGFFEVKISDLGVLPPVGPSDAGKVLVSDDEGKGHWKSPEELSAMSLDASVDLDGYWVEYMADGYVKLDGRYSREQLLMLAEKLPQK